MEPPIIVVGMGFVGGLAVFGPATSFRSAVSVLVALGFYAGWLFFLWRIAMVGVQVGPRGVRVRRVHRTDVIAWADVDRIWIGQSEHYDAITIWITTVAGKHVETPLWRKGTRTRHRNRVRLEPDDFYQVFVRLNAGAA